jgi:hypothetical protein
MLFRLFLLAFLALPTLATRAGDLVVVVNAHSGVEHLTHDDAINIFMGRYRRLPSGLAAIPIDLHGSLPEKSQFYRLLVDKDISEINTYWARLTFSGKASPPRQAQSTAEMLNWMARTPGAIGYIERTQVDARVRAVLSLAP